MILAVVAMVMVLSRPVFATGQTVAASDTMASLLVTVRDTPGRPVRPIFVSVLNLNDSNHQALPTRTDSLGQVHFRSLVPGPWRVSVSSAVNIPMFWNGMLGAGVSDTITFVLHRNPFANAPPDLLAAFLVNRATSGPVLSMVDSDAVAAAIAGSFLLDLGSGGDRGAPIQFVTAPSAGVQRWLARIVPLLRKNAPTALADSIAGNVWVVRLATVSVREQLVVVRADFLFCQPERTGATFADQEVEFAIPMDHGTWRPNAARVLSLGNGTCAAKMH